MICDKCGGAIDESVQMLIMAGIVDKRECTACLTANLPAKKQETPDDAEEWKRVAGIAQHYWQAKTTDFSQPVQEHCREWWKGRERILCITGETGTGKTHLACSIAMAVREKTGKSAYFLSTSELIEAFRSQAMGDPSPVVMRAEMTGVLILDDFGVEKVTDFAFDALFRIIDRKAGRVIITTNLTEDQMEDKYDSRIASRIGAGYVVKFEGKDRRATKCKIAREVVQ